MELGNIDPSKLKLVSFLKSNVGGYHNLALGQSAKPHLTTAFATKIIRKIFNENEGMLRGMSKKDFLARATEIFDQKGSDCEAFCPICFKTFVNWQDKERHVKSFHENDESGKFKCPSCSKTFMSKSSLNYHKDTAHAETKSIVTCNLCKKTFSHALSLKRHFKSIHSPASTHKIECLKCGVRFTRKDNLTKHEQRVHHLFNLDFSEAAKRTQQDDGSYKCNRCGENFTGDEAFSNLKDHIIAKCKQPAEIQCGDCGKPFSNQSDLKKHVDLKHLNKIQNFFCHKCGFCSAYKENLVRHLRKIHGERNPYLEYLKFESYFKRWQQNYRYTSPDATTVAAEVTTSSSAFASSSSVPVITPMSSATSEQQAEEELHCFECEDTFRRKSQLMRHAREKHDLNLHGLNILSEPAWKNPAHRLKKA